MSSRESNLCKLIALFVAVAGCACGEKVDRGGNGNRPSSPKTQNQRFQESRDPTAKLELAEDEKITAVGRPSTDVVNISTNAPRSFSVDLESGEVQSEPAFSKFDAAVTQIIPVWSQYAWLMFADSNQVGRNQNPPDAAGKFEIARASLGELIEDLGRLTPLAVTVEQLLLVDKKRLVVCTYGESAINLKSVPLPDLEGQKLIGGGAIGDPAAGAGYWVVTEKRIYVLDRRDENVNWESEPIELLSRDEEPTYVSFFYKFSDKKVKRHGLILGLFDGGSIASLKELD